MNNIEIIINLAWHTTLSSGPAFYHFSNLLPNMDVNHLQIQLFRHIKQHVPDPSQLAEMIAKALDISLDSAYRRMRGETLLDLEEAGKLCLHFNISLDRLMGLMNGKVIFNPVPLDEKNIDFEGYLKGMLRSMEHFTTFPDARLFYECKDIPIFYHFHSRELAAFKYHFWMKYLMQQPSFKTRKFSFEDYDDTLFDLGRKILHTYNSISSVEFWNTESINSTLKQIKFFYDTGWITRKADVILLYQKLKELFEYLEEVVASGTKIQLSEVDPDAKPASLDAYYNEIILGNNMIVVKLGPSSQITFFNYSGMRYTGTTDLEFGQEVFMGLERLTKSSTRLSTINEVERTLFFSEIRDNIQKCIDKT